MYLLDTDVVSQRTKQKADASVTAWLRDALATSLFLSVITIQEIRTGIEWMPEGRKRRSIEEWLECDVLVKFANRILPVDIAVADLCGRMIVEARRAKHRVGGVLSGIPGLDAWLAGAEHRPVD